jgi:predicted TIM-barrel fold metal-dependent hydrolase
MPKILLVGDLNASVIAHRAIEENVRLAARADAELTWEWPGTREIDDRGEDTLAAYDGIWCVPASPYASMSGALKAIRFARERGVPFLGTCGGFQHAVIEFARNAAKIVDADHEETNPAAAVRLGCRCSLEGVLPMLPDASVTYVPDRSARTVSRLGPTFRSPPVSKQGRTHQERRMRRLLVLGLGVLSVACKFTGGGNPPAMPQVTPPADAMAQAPPALAGPKVDHHQHLLSPELGPVQARAEETELRPVELPPDMAELLRHRAAAWDDPAALAQLYANNVVLAQIADQTLLLRDAIISGRDNVSDYLARRVFARAYTIQPVAYSENGPVKQIAVIYSRPQPRGDVSDYRHLGAAFYTVTRQTDEKWLITSEIMRFPGPPTYVPVNADALVRMLDEAGIGRAVVLSGAYIFESPFVQLPEVAARMRVENDWTAHEVSRHPTRLVGFCGVNPLTDNALPEIERCARELRLRGIKLHLGNSGVDLTDAAHLVRVQQVFTAANRLRLPIVVHIATGNPRVGRGNAEIFLNQVLPAAPDIVVQIAHLAGAGPNWNDEALAVFAEAIERGDRRTRNLYFDVATVADLQRNDRLQLLARQIRQIGPRRILFGSDGAFGGRNTPYQEWGTFRGMVPLSDAEFEIIRNNVAPYLR